MKKFQYVLSNSSGVKEEGSIFATTIEAAREKIQKENSIILSLGEEVKANNYFWNKPHLSFQDKMMFTKHMATMIKVGITITEAMEILINQTHQKAKKKLYENILEMLQSGQSLSKSLREYDYIFSEIFINMIATGEQSGTLEKTLEYLDLQLEKEYEIRKKVVGAFIYPAVIISITILMGFGIVIFIMPKITKIFSSMNIELPLITRALIGFSNFILHKTLLFLTITIGTIVGLTTLFRLKFLKPLWDTIALKLPVFGKLLIASNVARFSRTLHSLLQSGVPIIEALDITSKMITNIHYKVALQEARDKVQQGGRLGESLEKSPKLFPEIASKMIYIGEKTGSLETTTERIAELYEHTVDNITKNLSVLLEPLLLVFMGTLVGGIALSIILPIYQLPNLLAK